MKHPSVPGTQPQPPEPQPGLVLALERTGAERLADVGGKAANLGELLRAGLPVPAGFCLTTQAYRRATESAGLDAVHASLAAAAPEDLPGLATLAADARDLVLAADVPADVALAVREAYAALGPDVPVAVRSSATPRTCRSPVSPASRTPSSTSWVSRRSWPRSASAGPRSGRTAR